jgi:hypothetical protein
VLRSLTKDSSKVLTIYVGAVLPDYLLVLSSIDTIFIYFYRIMINFCIRELSQEELLKIHDF